MTLVLAPWRVSKFGTPLAAAIGCSIERLAPVAAQPDNDGRSQHLNRRRVARSTALRASGSDSREFRPATAPVWPRGGCAAGRAFGGVRPRRGQRSGRGHRDVRTRQQFPRRIALQRLLEDALDGAIAFLAADFGNIQLARPPTKALRIVAQRGFMPEFLAHFASVDGTEAACERAAKSRAQCVVADVNEDPAFEPHRAIVAASGFRAVLSTPLIDRSGWVHGVLSTHFRQPHRPHDLELRLTRTYARLIADAVARIDDAGRPLHPGLMTVWPRDRLTDRRPLR
jgi:GAF domain